MSHRFGDENNYRVLSYRISDIYRIYGNTRKYNVSLEIAGGYQLNLGKKFGLAFELRVNPQLLPLLNGSYYTVRNLSFGLGTGVNYKI